MNSKNSEDAEAWRRSVWSFLRGKQTARVFRQEECSDKWTKVAFYTVRKSEPSLWDACNHKKLMSDMSDQYGGIKCFINFCLFKKKTCELKGQLMGLVEEVSSLVEQSENLGGKCLLKFSLRWRGIILVDHVHVELPRVQHDCSMYMLLGQFTSTGSQFSTSLQDNSRSCSHNRSARGTTWSCSWHSHRRTARILLA